MKLLNNWRANNKQEDKFLVWIKLGRITAFKLYLDFSEKIYELTILNFGIKTSGHSPQKRNLPK
jgi:hypothetical protein